MEKPDKVIFFDGVCNLCNASVNFLLKVDRDRIFKYASLQGPFAQASLPQRGIETHRSVVYLSGGQFYIGAEAVLAILKDLGGGYRVLEIFLSIFPMRVLDFFYKLVADNRYRIFGKKEYCRIPSKEEAKLFIDK